MSHSARGLELDAWRLLMRLVPPMPRSLGLAQHVVRPVFERAPTAPVTAWVSGARMTLDPAQHVDGLLLFAPHLVDRAERTFLASRLRRGSTFLDLGAYLGWYAVHLAPVVGPSGQVLCVEAHAPTCERLRQHLDANGLPWVETASVAIMPTSGTVDLQLSEPTNAGSRRAVAGGDVHASTLPELLDARGIHRADAVKTDLEGQDAAVVTQALDHLPRSRWPRVWVCESPRSDDAVTPILARAGYSTRRLSRLNIGAWLD